MPGSIGAVVDPANVDSWVCELCENEETLEASVVSQVIGITFCQPLSLNSRTLIAYYVHGLQMKISKRNLGLQSIRSYERVNQLKGKAGFTFSVLFSHPNSPSLMLLACGWWKASIPLLATSGQLNVVSAARQKEQSSDVVIVLRNSTLLAPGSRGTSLDSRFNQYVPCRWSDDFLALTSCSSR